MGAGSTNMIPLDGVRAAPDPDFKLHLRARQNGCVLYTVDVPDEVRSVNEQILHSLPNVDKPESLSPVEDGNYARHLVP